MKKLIVITGGTKGIGKALVSKFAKEGFDIITCSRNETELKNLSESIQLSFPNISMFTFKADISKRTDIFHFLEFISSKTTSVNILINNTGVFIPGKTYEEEEGVLEHIMNTNLYSAYHLTRGILPTMVAKKQGHIFNICSTASIMPYINGGSYCISKYALLGMTKVLREEMKEHNIKVTAVLPGATYTSSWDGANLPEDRFIKPADIADAIFGAFQLSPNAVVEELLIRPQLGDI